MKAKSLTALMQNVKTMLKTVYFILERRYEAIVIHKVTTLDSLLQIQQLVGFRQFSVQLLQSSNQTATGLNSRTIYRIPLHCKTLWHSVKITNCLYIH